MATGEVFILHYALETAWQEAVISALIEHVLLAALVYSFWFWVKFGSVEDEGLTAKLFSPLASLLAITILWKCASSVFIMLFSQQAFPAFDSIMLVKTLYGFLLFLIFFFTYLYDNYRVFSLNRKEEEKQLELKATRAELRFLRSQLNPHFLYNSLNSIAALSKFDGDKAHDTVLKLSDYLRYTLKSVKVLSIPLSKELEANNLYLELEQVRYEDKLRVEKSISFENDIKVPSMITQPLIENAIKYGVEENNSEVILKINLEQIEEFILFIVENNFDGSQKHGEAANGLEVVQQYEALKPDLILLDVQMPKLTGFEALELIKGDVKVIFTTAFDQYALKAFEVNAVDYLQKPFSRDRLLNALSKGNEIPTSKDLELSPEEIKRLAVKSGGEIQVLQQDEIEAIESADDYVIIHARNKQFVVKQTMNYFEKGLPEDRFYRIHRTAIVKADFIDKLEPKGKETYQCITKNGQCLSVSKTGFKKLKTRLTW